MKAKLVAVVIFVFTVFSVFSIALGKSDSPQSSIAKQIVVHVRHSDVGLVYEIGDNRLQRGAANSWLAGIKDHECKDCQIVPILDDNVELGAITQISEMAINAGFKDIR